MEIYYDGGIVIREKSKSILLDPRSFPSFKPDIIIVSHAHSDHYNLRVLRGFPEIPKIMSQATRYLIDEQKTLKNVIEVTPGDQLSINNFDFSIHEAGHVLGSIQTEITIGNNSIVYTGDFNLQARIILKPAKIVKADILITEATYGHPRYTFPQRTKVYRQVLELIKKSVSKDTFIFGRSMGTAQELTALIAFSKIGAYPLVHPYIAKINKVYEIYGEELGVYKVAQRGRVPGEGPAIMPLTEKIIEKESSKSIVCTGWAAGVSKRNHVPLSSHADFKQIIQYVLRCAPEKVYTVYGFSKFLADFLKNEYDIDAVSLL